MKNTENAKGGSLHRAGSVVDEAKLREAQHIIWRNLPGFPTTFGPCARNCGRGLGGRGGGPCICCAQDDITAMVGEELAGKYVSAVRGIRDLEDAMLNYQTPKLSDGREKGSSNGD